MCAQSSHIPTHIFISSCLFLENDILHTIKGNEETAMAESPKTNGVKARAKTAAAKAREKSAAHGSGFMHFIRTQGVIGLAVGLAIGTAAGDTVTKLVEGFISPIVQFVVGSQDALTAAVWHVELFGRSADFAWGAFVSSAISLLATALVIYWIIHIAKLDRLDKKDA
jgi:large conductance mechanosensitive channel